MVEHELPKLGARVRFPSPAPLAPRLVSWGWDYLLILGWLLLVFLLIGLPQILGWIDLSPIWTDQNSADVGITILTVLPYFLYLTFTEIGPTHATWGKRRAGIAVADRDGDWPRTGGVVVRNLVKVMPWQLGHMGTMRLVTSAEVSTAAISLQVASLGLLALILVPILLRRRGIHDVVGRTRVVSAN